MSSAIALQHWLGQAFFFLFLLVAVGHVAAVGNNPKDNFCRRFSHQSTVVDDRLYIDGGYIDYSSEDIGDNNHNTWLGYHDLNNFGSEGDRLNPEFRIGLEKNGSIPTVAGGVLWPDSINKRFYLYGGDWLSSRSASQFNLLGYDILNNQWDNFGPSKQKQQNITAYGAGVGVSETGIGYYYGGWVSEKSMEGGPKDAVMTSDFYSYTYDNNSFDPLTIPDDLARAEGGMVWVPTGDYKGVLVYMGGLTSRGGNTTSPQEMDEILLYDATDDKWYKQKATGVVPQNRAQFCLGVASAPDKSSFNIYLWGGKAVYPPLTNVSSYSDLYILSMPSFRWVKVLPDTWGNATGALGRYGSSCNMISHMSNMLIIGGNYTNQSNTACDLPKAWGVHGFYTGTADNAGNSSTWWGFPAKDTDTNVVPLAVWNATGGDKNGNAVIREPDGGFSTTNQALPILFNREWVSPNRKPSRNLDGPRRLSTGAIVGIAIGCTVAVAIMLFAWWHLGKRVLQRREERRRAEVTQQAQRMHREQQTKQDQQLYQNIALQGLNSHHSYVGSSSVVTSVVTPPLPASPQYWDPAPEMHYAVEATELPVDNGHMPRENNFTASPVYRRE